MAEEAIEQLILDELLKTEFKKMKVKLKWVWESNKNTIAWVNLFMAIILGNIIYLNSRNKKWLKENKIALRKILQHELLHLLLKRGHGKRFLKEADKRGIIRR